MATYIPGVDLSQIIDGKTLGAHWEFYTVNVKYLETLTHEQFCQEFPNAAREIERASKIQDRLADWVGAHVAPQIEEVPHG